MNSTSDPTIRASNAYALKVKLHGDMVVAARYRWGYLHRGFEN
ncbi:hypothetical protein [endosymbiont of Lamellibrachia barhami]|nr:hypothetical protein [endosymbiont of Lamellibrachia barhami]